MGWQCCNGASPPAFSTLIVPLGRQWCWFAEHRVTVTVAHIAQMFNSFFPRLFAFSALTSFRNPQLHQVGMAHTPTAAEATTTTTVFLPFQFTLTHPDRIEGNVAVARWALVACERRHSVPLNSTPPVMRHWRALIMHIRGRAHCSVHFFFHMPAVSTRAGKCNPLLGRLIHKPNHTSRCTVVTVWLLLHAFKNG